MYQKPETLDELLQRFSIRRWDWLLIGDGSGCSWDMGAGWASILVERESLATSYWYGGCNSGTNNFAEIMAYLTPLTWLASKGKHDGSPIQQVHIVTDSEYCKQRGQNRDGAYSRQHAGLWAIAHTYERLGIVLTWHHAKRGTLLLNKVVDRISREARLAISREKLAEKAGAYFGLSFVETDPVDPA